MLRRFRLALLSAVATAVFCHCSVEDQLGIDLNVPTPVAVGATVTATVSGGSKALMDQPRVDDGSVFAVIDPDSSVQRSSIELRALQPGKTTFRARGDNGKEIGTMTRDIEAAVPDRLSLTGVTGCQAPFHVGAGSKFSITAQRYRGTSVLHGTGGAYPLSSNVADQVGDGLDFVAHASRGLGTVRSRMGSAEFSLQVFEAVDATSMDVESPPSTPVGKEIGLSTFLFISSRKACTDAFGRDVVVATPEICERVNPSASPTISFATKKVGICEVTVTLPGTTVSAKAKLNVIDAPGSTNTNKNDAGAPPTDAGADADADAAD